jgi:hypothetical protein
LTFKLLLTFLFLAIWGLPGYAFMGVHREIRKMFGSSVLNYIIAARTARGFEDAQACSPEERSAIINQWNSHKDEYQSTKMKIAEQGGPELNPSGYLSPKGFMQTRHLPFEERKRLHKERQVKRRETAHKEAAEGSGHKFCPFCRRDKPHRHTPRATQDKPVVPHVMDGNINDEFEHAIHTSVAATSRGDPEEDDMIERAIRASVRELQSAEDSKLSDQEALERAIQASIGEAGHRPSTSTIEYTEKDAEHERALEYAIQQSLLRYHVIEPEDDGEEDEAVKLAMIKSLEDGSELPDPEEIDHALLEAIKQSKANALKEDAEDEILLEQVIKQSLMEDSRDKSYTSRPNTEGEGSSDGTGGARNVASGGETPRGRQGLQEPPNTAVEGDSAADEEALRLAIQASLKG